MLTTVLITPMMLAISPPFVEIPSALVYDHQTQTSSGLVSSGELTILAATLTTKTGTGSDGCQFDGSCKDSDTDGDS